MLITSVDELTERREQWEDLRHRCGGSIHTSYWLSKIWLEAYGDIVVPRIVLVEERGDVVGIAPLALRQNSVAGLPIKLLSLIGDADMRLGLNPLRVMYEPGRLDVLDQLMKAIKGQEWNMFRANFMDDDEDVQRFLDIMRTTWKLDDQRPSTTMTCSFPEGSDAMSMFGKATRSKLRQKIRKLEENDRLRFRILSEEDMGRAVNIHAQQHIERWNAKGGSIFQNPENVMFLRNAMEESLRRGFGCGYELLVDEEVAAQQLNFFENGMVYGYRAGMNNKFAEHSPGWALNYYAFSDMMRKGFTTINLGEGGESYKTHMGGRETSLIGGIAKRGTISLLSKFVDSYPFQALDARLGVRRRLIRY